MKKYLYLCDTIGTIQRRTWISSLCLQGALITFPEREQQEKSIELLGRDNLLAKMKMPERT
jgi:hypothetical protein